MLLSLQGGADEDVKKAEKVIYRYNIILLRTENQIILLCFCYVCVCIIMTLCVHVCGGIYIRRIHEKKDHQLSFKKVASGFISKGYLDPTDGVLYCMTSFMIFA